MSEPEVLFEQRGASGIITLNRPKALNALTLGMVRAMMLQLKAWAQDTHVQAVVIRGAGDRAFCAGGDIRALYDSGREKTDYASAFWGEEYQLNTLIKEYPKPYVALIQGVVMGGGVGVSLHGAQRVACETTTFAMPETGIGLFPDVGGTYFLSRLPGRVGLYLALTGARLKAADLHRLGLVTHVAPLAAFDEITTAIAGGEHPDHALRGFAEAPASAPIDALRERIDHHFGGESVEQILQSLDSAGDEWALATAATLRTKSPTSQKIAFRQMMAGRTLSFREAMVLEFRITERIQKGHDFYEGVRATILDKDGAPRWNPAELRDVKGFMVDDYFQPLSKEWNPDR